MIPLLRSFSSSSSSLLLLRASLSTSFHSYCLASEKNSLYFMEKNPQDKDEHRERLGKEACESAQNKRVSDDIMPHILNLYASRATSEDFKIYAQCASFEDPLMCAQGVQQIKSAFYSLAKVFSESRIVKYEVKEIVLSPGQREILIDNKQYYKMLGKDINVISLIKLYVEGGKVIRHEDWWDKKPLWTKDTVKLPLVGRTMEMTRRASMLVTHGLMGFGRDPNM